MNDSKVAARIMNDSVGVRSEVREFIDSINFDVSHGIKTPNGSQAIPEKELPEEDRLPDFSNRRLIFRDETFVNYYSKAQRWLGHITEINGSAFKAR